jgi:hypothetical protein
VVKHLASRAHSPLLGGGGRSGDVPPLAVVLSPSSSPKLTESQVNAAGIKGVQWGARLALTVAFPKLEGELDLLGSGTTST